ncbi:MAG TPA: 1-(5-phosphoribosyl)-5-[(5-phosphoribosylamino)methylideneamino]imidazole-4-carboxamide isomerase [Methanospirillum sp.]|nr:1-(5-phosphoribosyl)-5-[(5-phosphoribosylamino)methylideneamino]imidazole-4-carboxamide isomerase [Methanospirillum sp.]
MNVFPAVDILNGRCVQLVQGKRESATEYGDPLTCADEWLDQGADALHIVNLDGAFGTAQANADLIKKVIYETGVEIQLGGGIRSVDDARSWLETGVERVIMSTFAVSNPDCLTTLSEEFGSARIMAGVDAKSGQIVIDGWERPAGDFLTFADLFVSKGAGSLLYTNVDVEGLCQGVNPEPVEKLTSRVTVPVTIAGGITTSDDILSLKAAGAKGIVLGSALYAGKITFEQALKAAQ